MWMSLRDVHDDDENRPSDGDDQDDDDNENEPNDGSDFGAT